MLLAWADYHFTWLDGVLQLRGIDIYERARGPLDRFIALLFALRMEGIEWASEEDREELRSVLDWPALTEQRRLDESTRMAREALIAMGGDPSMLG